MAKVKIAPSILSADFTNLESEIKKVEDAGADLLHIDVMDGHFVPNITIGQPVVSAIRKKTKLPLDVHLMIEDPDIYLNEFIDAGADYLAVHLEACKHLHRTVSSITNRGIKAGVALNPATPLGGIKYILSEINFVLLMTVNPGFSGQEFIPSSISKIVEMAEIIKSKNLDIEIEVDGGINEKIAPKLIKAGANIIVAGNAIYHGDTPNVIKALRGSTF